MKPKRGTVKASCRCQATEEMYGGGLERCPQMAVVSVLRTQLHYCRAHAQHLIRMHSRDRSLPPVVQAYAVEVFEPTQVSSVTTETTTPTRPPRPARPNRRRWTVAERKAVARARKFEPQLPARERDEYGRYGHYRA